MPEARGFGERGVGSLADKIEANDGSMGHLEDFFVDDIRWAVRFLLVDPKHWWPGKKGAGGTDRCRGIDWPYSMLRVDLRFSGTQ